MSKEPEFSRMVDRRHLTAAPVTLAADEAQRAALANRFGLVAIDRLEADITLAGEGDTVVATGTLEADITQSCAISGEDLATAIREPVSLRFVPEEQVAAPDEEIELGDVVLDEIGYAGTSFDLGEALAESLALAIDPYATGPAADAVRAQYGLADEGPKGPLAEALGKLSKKN